MTALHFSIFHVASTVRNPARDSRPRGRPFGWERRLPGNVYVVDDDASLRTALKRLLNKAGYDVETYSSAQEYSNTCLTRRDRVAYYRMSGCRA